MATQEDRRKLAGDLEAIRSASGVAVLVIPQRQEGAYGYLGARHLLGNRLTTSHILDIGGGSLQIAGESHSFGALFGQKLWQPRTVQGAAQQFGTAVPVTADDAGRTR